MTEPLPLTPEEALARLLHGDNPEFGGESCFCMEEAHIALNEEAPKHREWAVIVARALDAARSVTPSQPEPREAAVTRLAIHLHRKGVGCDGHKGDDPAVADVMHRDDAYDIYDHLVGAGRLRPPSPGTSQHSRGEP